MNEIKYFLTYTVKESEEIFHSVTHLRQSTIPAESSSLCALYSNEYGSRISNFPLILTLLIIFTVKHYITVTKQRKSSS